MEVKHFLVTTKGTIYPTRCALGRVGEPKFVTYTDVIEGLFVFSGLEPGLYFVRMIEGQERFIRYVFPEGIVEEMTFSVAAGKPIYIGVVGITERHDVRADRSPHTWTFNQKDYIDTVEFRPEPAAEARAWAWFVERYGETRWGRMVKMML
jgi:acyl CoA:acetate/3-ketoacid CoA transferase